MRKETRLNAEVLANAAKDANKRRYVRIAWSVGLLVTAVWLIGLFIQSRFCFPKEGVFTTLTTLFSALAFAGVIVTIFMQRDELELQRNEMELTRAEFKKQNRTLSRQRFENTFFQLLQRQAEIRSGIKLFDGVTLKEEGTKSFDYLYGQLDGEILNIKRKAANNLEGFNEGFGENQKLRQQPFEVVKVTTEFHSIYKKHQNDLGHYYKHLLIMFRFVLEMKVNIKKKRYLDFIKAELSQNEMLCLFYFGISDYGLKEFKLLLINSSFFGDLNKDLLIHNEHLSEYVSN